MGGRSDRSDLVKPRGPRNSLERQLGPGDLAILEAAAGSASGDELHRVLGRIYMYATSVAPYRPRTDDEREAYRAEAAVAAIEALRGARPRRRRTESLARYLENAMQTAIKAWRRKNGSRREFTTDAFDGLLNAVDAADDATSIDLATHVDTTPVTDLAVTSPLRAEVNSTDADWREEDSFGARSRRRRNKDPHEWSISTPDLPELVWSTVTTRELIAAEQRRSDELEVSEFVDALVRATRWKVGDPPIGLGRRTTQQREFGAQALAVLRGAARNEGARKAIENVQHWLFRRNAPAGPIPRLPTRRRPTKCMRRSWIGGVKRYLDVWPDDGHKSVPWVPVEQRVYDQATQRERDLFDAFHVKRGERNKRGIATLARDWYEDDEKLAKEARAVVHEFKTRALELEREDAERDAAGNALRRFVGDPSAYDFQTYQRDARYQAQKNSAGSLRALKEGPRSA